MCKGKACTGGTALNCDDKNPCTSDTCDKLAGCMSVPNAGPCDDGDACTTAEVCKDKTCAGGGPPNCADGNPCTDDGCTKASGCVHAPSLAACDDKNACTTLDKCAGGTCVGGPKQVCDDGDVCTTDACNQASGCGHSKNAAPCDDGNLCTTKDACSGGACAGSVPPNCDDGKPCTQDTCAVQVGCTHTTMVDGSSCGSGGTCKAGSCAAGCGNVGGLQAGAPWPMEGYCPTHQGRSPHVGPQTGNVRWTFDTNYPLQTSPAIGADGTVYVGTSQNVVAALSPQGKLMWAFKPGEWNFSSPAIGADGTVYVGSGQANSFASANVYAIQANGTKKWAFATGGAATSASPAIGGDGTVYIGCNDKYLYALAPNGTKKWAFNTNSWVWSPPSIAPDGTVIVSFGGTSNSATAAYVYALNPNGTTKWTYEIGASVASAAAIGFDGSIYLGSSAPALWALGANGKVKWSFSTKDASWPTAALGLDGTIFMGSNDKNFYSIKPNGTLSWSFPTGGKVGSSAAIGADGTVYVGSGDGKVYALHANGSVKWSVGTGAAVLSSPAIGADGSLYIGSDDGKLYAIGGCNTDADCNDGDACTVGDACKNKACVGGSVQPCDDTNPCTVNSCAKAVGCVFTASTAPCNDGNACTTVDACQNKACVGGSPPNCDDGNLCTKDECTKTAGCGHSNNQLSCTDNDICTSLDTCTNGACVAGAAMDCSDGNTCTLDGCDKVGGCTHGLPATATVGTGAPYVGEHSVVWTGSGYGMVWRDLAAGIYFSALDAKGKVTIAPKVIVPKQVDFFQNDLAIAWSGKAFALVWRHSPSSGPDRVRFATLDSTGQLLSTPAFLDVAPPSYKSGSKNAVVAWIPSAGEFGVSWDGAKGGDARWDLMYTRVSEAGAKKFEEVYVTSDTAGVTSNPRLAWTGADFGVTWWDSRDNSYEVYFTRMSADGVKLASEQKITVPVGSSASGWFPDITWNGSVFLISWFNGYKAPLYLQLVSKSNEKVGAAITIAKTFLGVVAPTTTGFHVLWTAEATPNALSWTTLSSSGKVGGTWLVTDSPNKSRYLGSLVQTGTGYGLFWNEDQGTGAQALFRELGCP